MDFLLETLQPRKGDEPNSWHNRRTRTIERNRFTIRPSLQVPVTRQEVQAAVAKKVGLRALHGAVRWRGVLNAVGAGVYANRSPTNISLMLVASSACSWTAASSNAD